MRFLTPEECNAWCVDRRAPLDGSGLIRGEGRDWEFHLAKISYPKDSGHKVYLARRLYALVGAEAELLVRVSNWDIWPSSQHLPLYRRFREGLRDLRTLDEAPGHLFRATDGEDAVSLIALSLLFFWDGYGVSSTGRDAFHVSHDEYCYFASRDPEVAARVAEEFEKDEALG